MTQYHLPNNPFFDTSHNEEKGMYVDVIPDAILPSQLDHSHFLSGEQRLLEELLFHAVCDLRFSYTSRTKDRNANKLRGPEARKNILDWFEGADAKVTYQMVCDALNIKSPGSFVRLVKSLIPQWEKSAGLDPEISFRHETQNVLTPNQLMVYTSIPKVA